MIVTKGFLAGRIITGGYGPKVTTPLSAQIIDPNTLIERVKTFVNDTKNKTYISLIKRTVEEK